MATVYLIPTWLHEEGLDSIPPETISAIKQCQVLFVENERTTRRYFKKLWKIRLPGQEIIIDDYEWHTIPGSDTVENRKALSDIFTEKIKENKNIGILSEAGCPGVADPGQVLVQMAQQMNVTVKPLVGPNSILLALIASGMNGQHFQFHGYLPIENQKRVKAIKDLETESARKNCTQIFIETPYRNNQLLEALLSTCNPSSKLCVAADLSSEKEWIKNKTIANWQKEKPDLHKRPVIFLLHSGLPV